MVGIGNRTRLGRGECEETGFGELDLEEEHRHVQELLSNGTVDDEIELLNRRICLAIAQEYNFAGNFEEARKYLERNYLEASSEETLKEHEKLLAELKARRTGVTSESLNRSPSEMKPNPERDSGTKDEPEGSVDDEESPDPDLNESFISCEEEEESEGNNGDEVDGKGENRPTPKKETVRMLKATIDELKEKLKEYADKSAFEDTEDNRQSMENEKEENKPDSEGSDVEEVGQNDSCRREPGNHQNTVRIVVVQSEFKRWRDQMMREQLRNFAFSRYHQQRSNNSRTRAQNSQSQNTPDPDPEVITTPPSQEGSSAPAAAHASAGPNQSANARHTSSTGWKYVDPDDDEEDNPKKDKKSEKKCMPCRKCSECCFGCCLCFLTNMCS